MQPHVYRAHMIVWAYAQKRAFAQAFTENEIWRRREDGPWNWSFQAWLYGQRGRESEARRAIEKLEKWAQDHPADVMPMLPTAYLGVNDKAKALASLERSFQERSNVILLLRVDRFTIPSAASPASRSYSAAPAWRIEVRGRNHRSVKNEAPARAGAFSYPPS